MGPPESGEALVGTRASISADQHAADDPIVSDAADIPTEVIVDFTALLFDTLKFAADEFVSIGHDNPATRQPFSTAVMAPRLAPAYIAQLPETANIYFGINPTKGPARQKAGRGKEADITRLAVLPADLDFKNIGCGSPETARTIIGDLTAAMGTRPSVITESGHGLHAYWPVADGRITDRFTIIDAKALLTRWGYLVAAVAEQHNARADSIFDLTRMLRVPGTFNNGKAAK
ncbi:MAG: hypothetical protein ACLP9Y_19025 [Mycobacterium sp.]